MYVCIYVYKYTLTRIMFVVEITLISDMHLVYTIHSAYILFAFTRAMLLYSPISDSGMFLYSKKTNAHYFPMLIFVVCFMYTTVHICDLNIIMLVAVKKVPILD